MWSAVQLSCNAFPSVSWIYGFLSDNQSLFSLWLFPAFWVSGQPAVESSVGFCPVCRVRVWSWALTALCFPRWTTPSGQIISSRSVSCLLPYPQSVLLIFTGRDRHFRANITKEWLVCGRTIGPVSVKTDSKSIISEDDLPSLPWRDVVIGITDIQRVDVFWYNGWHECGITRIQRYGDVKGTLPHVFYSINEERDKRN